jgi:DNA-binding transcriptional LysR family regulator
MRFCTHVFCMNVNALKYLRLVIERQGFAEAARAAQVSQPAITQAMHALEQELGLVLFEKQGRKKVPTDAARALAQGAGHLEDLLADVQRAPVDGGARAPQAFEAGLAPAAALLYGPVIEQTWRVMAPDGLLRITGGSASEMLHALSHGALDLVIAPLPRRYQAAGVMRHLLHTSTPTVFARRGHPLLEARTLGDIAGADWAVTGASGTAGNMIEEALRVRGLAAPRILLQCADYRALLGMVARSDLLCIVPHPLLVLTELQDQVRPLHLLEHLPHYEVCLFWPETPRVAAAKAVDAVVAALKAFRGG